MARKYSPKAGKKVEKVMHEFKEGDLKSGRSNKKVTSRKQAIAIGLSEAREAGAKVPKKATGKKAASKKKNATKKKTATKKTATKKKTAAKKSTTKKAATKKKTAAKKSTTKKTVRKKTATKKSK